MSPTPEQIAAWCAYIITKESAVSPPPNTKPETQKDTGADGAADQDAVNRYADHCIRRDKLTRNDGRPELDRDTAGRPLI